MTDQSKPVSRPWRRFLRFSVRGLVVVVLLVGGWLGWVVRSARLLARCRGGDRKSWAVTYSTNGNVRAINRARRRTFWPRGLVDRLGVDYFGNVVMVDLFGKGSDLVLAQVRNSVDWMF